MVDPQTLNAQGIRVRDAITILVNALPPARDAQMALEVAYVKAVVNNIMLLLEQDAGVGPGYFGSVGAKLAEINPFDGKQLPPPISNELPLPAPPPLEVPAPTTIGGSPT